MKWLPVRNIAVYLFVVVVVAMALCAPARSEDKISVIHFAEEANWPPFTPNKFGKAEEGLSLVLMQAIFSKLGIEVEIELLPQERMLHYLKEGLKDGATVISKNAERMEYLDFSEPLFAKRGYVYYRKDRKTPLAWNDFADLKGLRVGIVSGHNYGDEFRGAVVRHNLNVLTASKESQLFEMLLAERIDCFLCIDFTATCYMKDQPYKGNIVHAPKSYFQKDYHIAFSRKSSVRTLLPKVNDIIVMMKKDGSMGKMLAPHRQD